MVLFFFERKNRYTFCHNVYDSIREMTPKQTIHHFWEGNDTKNSKENASTEDYISDYRLKLARQ